MGNKTSTMMTKLEEQDLQGPSQTPSETSPMSEWEDLLFEDEESCPGLVGSVSIRERDLASSLLQQGLDPSDHDIESTRISFCALLSNLIYKVKTKRGLKQALLHHMSLVGEGEDFAKSIRHVSVRADKCWDHRFLTVLKGKTLYVAWKGTDNLRDLVRDLSCLPKRCLLWSHAFPNISAHSGMVDIIEHQFHYLPDLLDLLEHVQETGGAAVEKIVFTGHSLGGGLGQVALMAAYGQQTLDFYHWPDQTIRNKARRLLQNVTFSCQAFASPMIFSVDHDVTLSDKESDVLTRFQRSCTMWYYEHDLMPRVPALTEYFMPAMRAIIKQMGQHSGQQRAVGPATQLLFGKMAKAGAKKLLWPMMQGAWDDETIAAFETYKHISTLVCVSTTASSTTKKPQDPTGTHVNPQSKKSKHISSNEEKKRVGVIQARRTTHEEIMEQKFDDSISGFELLQMHRLLPKCLGRYMIERRKALLVVPANNGTGLLRRDIHKNEESQVHMTRKKYSSGSFYVGNCKYGDGGGDQSPASTGGNQQQQGHQRQQQQQQHRQQHSQMQPQRCGRGTFSLANGDWYAGDWDQDKMDGYGTYYWRSTGDWYAGRWKKGYPHGRGYHTAMGKGIWYQGQRLCEQKDRLAATSDHHEQHQFRHHNDPKQQDDTETTEDESFHSNDSTSSRSSNHENPLSRQDMTLREWQRKFSMGGPYRKISIVESPDE